MLVFFANVIPDTATMGGTIRTFDEETRSFIKERIEEITECTAKSFRASAEVIWGSGCPTLVNDKDLTICSEKYIKELLGEDKTFSVAKLNAMAGNQKSAKTSGSEDFAYISQKSLPSC